MRHRHRQAIGTVAELGQQHAAPADAAGQGMVLHFHRFQLLSRPLALDATPPMRRFGWWLQ